MERAWQNWKVTLAYDGSDYQGWQVQPDLPTIQGSLAEAIARLTGERVLPQGSGRTDAGVHALGQVASFHLLSPLPPDNLVRALNRVLPASIRALHAELAPPEFHARHSCRGKVYEYRVWQGSICPPTLSRYVHACRWEFRLDRMQSAAQMVVGEHDFTSFAASEPQVGSRSLRPPEEAKSCVRHIYQSEWRIEAAPEIQGWQADSGTLFIYRVYGSGFLHHMVRNLVGTFLDVGRGRLSPESLSEMLQARRRSASGPTAPASGLFLMQAIYPDCPA